jgi:hypothetical protein
MSKFTFVKPQRVPTSDPELTEKWVQDRIAEAAN